MTCPECGEEIVANTCQTDIRTEQVAEALAALLLAVHMRMAHPAAPRPDTAGSVARAFFSVVDQP